MLCFEDKLIPAQGDYWSFNLAGAYLPIVLLQFNVSTGSGTVTETYRQYVYIYLPGILGAVLALISVQLPLVGRKWSLVFSALCQGLSMALYTQVRSTAGYVGLNALEYVMQTVGCIQIRKGKADFRILSTSTLYCTHQHQSFLILLIVGVRVACCHASGDWLALWHHLLVR